MLKNAYANSLKIFGAYKKEKLFGIIRVIADGYSIIFIQDILVLPEYQHLGIGMALLKRILETYQNTYQKILLTDKIEKTIPFYKELQLVFWTYLLKSVIMKGGFPILFIIKIGAIEMIQICHNEKEKVYQAIRTGNIDAAAMSLPNLIDDILLTMKKHNLLKPLSFALEEKRRDNHHIPLDILLCLAVAAKMKQKTSLTDVPFAVTNAELLAELGWNIWNTERDINEGLFSESVMRKLIAKYSSEEWISFYNDYVQKQVLETMQLQPSIHILDCTKIPVNLNNENYKESTVVTIDGETMRGYKLGVLRGVLDDSGIAEEIVFGTLKTHDLELTRELLKTSSCLKEHDILINDRGFLSREILNYLSSRQREHDSLARRCSISKKC